MNTRRKETSGERGGEMKMEVTGVSEMVTQTKENYGMKDLKGDQKEYF